MVRRDGVRALAAFAALTMVSCGSDGGAGRGPGGGGDGGASADAGGGGGDGSSVGADGGGTTDTRRPATTAETELWYSVDDLLVRIVLDANDGSAVSFDVSRISGGPEVGQNAITMVRGGSLLLARLSRNDDLSYFYFIADPPRDGSDVTPVSLGVMPEAIMVEGLYEDCDGRIYAMDTGENDSSAAGNRLLRFTGDVLGGDFSYVVVSDLGTASVADIDDMGPGIDGNTITDNPGLAIDTGRIHAFNYETGSGTQVATGGTFGIHALGGVLFTDGRSRLYVLSNDAELFEVDPQTFSLSDALGSGPTPDNGAAGWSGLAGPLTECETGFELI